MLNGMIVEPEDNVVVAIEPVKKGDFVRYYPFCRFFA